LVPVTLGDPWKKYKERMYEIEMGGIVTVCQKDPDIPEGFDIREISVEDQVKERIVHKLRQNIHHENFLHFCEIFSVDKAVYTVTEHMVISCDEIVSSLVPLKDIHLATIICQVSAT
jgi:hypothetical protein